MNEKKDDGIIPGLGITEEYRDLLAKRDWTKPSDRSEHPDNWTTKECQDKKFSGWRINAFVMDVEYWIVGRVLATRKLRTVQQNPGVLGDMIEEACLTNGSLIEVDGIKRMKGNEAKKHGR